MEVVEIDDDGDEIDDYGNVQELELRELQKDREFIVDDKDMTYARAMAEEKRRIIERGGGAVSHSMGGIQKARQVGDDADKKGDKDQWADGDDEDVLAQGGKKGRGGKHNVCPSLDDVIVEIDMLCTAITSLKSILEDRGVSLLTPRGSGRHTKDDCPFSARPSRLVLKTYQ